ncbi:MAG: RluA family pseudouridine synthase [Terriglobia bacterium]
MNTKPNDDDRVFETRVIAANPAEPGERLDVLLARELPSMSRSQLQRLIRLGCVEIGSRPAVKTGQTVASGDRIEVRLAKKEVLAEPEDLPLEIVYEDQDLVVVNKAAGMVAHPGAGIRSGTLVNALLYHIRELSSTAGEDRPGIVHRLDKMTSGLVIVAKNDAAHRALSAAFKAREIRKTYIALVHGLTKNDEGVIDTPIGRDTRDRYRMRTNGACARDALTEYRVLRRLSRFTLLRVAPRTGRTHQIRVHLASIGHSVAGDTLYGAPAQFRVAHVMRKTLPRTFLHASALEFRHPSTGVALSFEAPLPAELVEFLSSLA